MGRTFENWLPSAQCWWREKAFSAKAGSLVIRVLEHCSWLNLFYGTPHLFSWFRRFCFYNCLFMVLSCARWVRMCVCVSRACICVCVCVCVVSLCLSVYVCAFVCTQACVKRQTSGPPPPHPPATEEAIREGQLSTDKSLWVVFKWNRNHIEMRKS